VFKRAPLAAVPRKIDAANDADAVEPLEPSN